MVFADKVIICFLGLKCSHEPSLRSPRRDRQREQSFGIGAARLWGEWGGDVLKSVHSVLARLIKNISASYTGGTRHAIVVTTTRVICLQLTCVD